MSDSAGQVVKDAVQAEAKSLVARAAAFVRANAFKAIAVSTFVGAVAGHLI